MNRPAGLGRHGATANAILQNARTGRVSWKTRHDYDSGRSKVSNAQGWTKEQQANTLAAIDVMKTFFEGDPAALGPSVLRHANQLGTEGLVGGLVNLCGMFVKSIADQGSSSAVDLLNEAEKVATGTEVTG